MKYYSQRSDVYGSLNLGKSKLTINGYGCLLVSVATLFQRDPVDILKAPGCITDAGLSVLAKMAAFCGGVYKGESDMAPAGWCIAVTDHYKPQGVDTHFFCVNKALGLQIDPLDKNPAPEPLTYKILKYRLFNGAVLGTSAPVPPDWKATAEAWSKANDIVVSGWENPEQPMSQVRVIEALRKYHDRFNS